MNIEDFDKKPTAKEKAELRAKIKARKTEFDKEAKEHICWRCGKLRREAPVVARITREVSRKADFLLMQHWFCQPCFDAIGVTVDDIQAAKLEADRPRLEAEAAERIVKQAALKAELETKQAEVREKMNASRAEKGLPPLVEPAKTPAPKKPASKSRKPKETR
jgi:hypothetical protein